MKGNSPLFKNTSSSLLFKLNLQLFASKNISDTGIKLQNSVHNIKLRNLIGELYRNGATVGDGSAMAAASEQVKTGVLIKDRDHIKKIEERIKNINNIMKSQNLDSNDIKYAKKLLKDMERSLKGEY